MKARAYGMEGIRVDGNDVLAVYVATRRAVVRARAGGGPTFIEALTYRLGGHSSSDDPTRYRDEREVEGWRRRDPLALCRRFLEGDGLWSEEEEQEAVRMFEEEISAAIRQAEAEPRPALRGLFEDVYARVPWHLEEEWSELRAVSGERAE